MADFKMQMKRAVLTALFAFVATAVLAQKSAKVTATIVDGDTGEGIAGAVVSVAPKANPQKANYYTSGYAGAVTIPSLAFGEYILTVEFLGYENLEQEVTIAKAPQNLGKLELQPGVRIETVVKEVKQMRTSQKGDTVSYNANAFKVANDADVEGLLKKMPGITITDGAVEAQGEEVKKIFVDGKEFFGEDVTTAIKSLPAEAVDRIEVYNKLSDSAEFSGMDDGEGYKAINIVTRPGMKQGQFGRIYAGFGYDADSENPDTRFKYLAGGNVNLFNGDSRISILGLFNNVNQQNFSFEDILGVSGGGGGRRGGMGQFMTRPQSGVARVNAFGVNYSDSWGKRDQVTFQGSYFFNNTNTENNSTTDRWYEAPYIDTLATRGYSDTRAFNHRFNGRLEWKISDNQNLMIRPSFSFQSNDPYSWTRGWQWGEKGYSRTDNFNDADNSGYRMQLFAVYRAKLGKDGRTITVNGRGAYANNKNNSLSYSNQLGYQPDRPEFDPLTGAWDPAQYVDLRYLRNDAPSSNYNFQGEFTYTEPVAKHAQVSFQYRAEYQHQERDKQSFRTDSDFLNGVLQSDLSNSYESNYLTQRVGPGFRYSKEKNTFVANVFYQRSSLDGQVLQSEQPDKIKHNYNDVTYFMMGQLMINRENSLRLFVSSYTNNPSVTQLQGIYDLSNAQNISSGNPELNPSYNHSINFHYVNSNVEKGRTFMWMFGFNGATDYITNNVQYNGTTTIDGKPYSYMQYTRPINMDGYWSLRTHLSYGLPIGFLKSNFNVMAGITYSTTPSQIDGQRNDAENMGYNFRAVLGSNISENVDFTLSWNGNYNIAKNSILTGADAKNRYFNHTASGNLKVVFPLGFTLTASASYTQNVGFTNNYNDDFLLMNAYIGKKVFRNKRGEVMFGVNDILNQNKGFVRSTGSGWTQNATNSVIGRYYMVQFTYNLRRFGKKGSTNIRDYDGMDQATGGGRRMGPGGPGGPPPGGFGPR